jgi:hypothetical protein
MRNFFEIFLRARRLPDFSHSQDPELTLAGSIFRSAATLLTDPNQSDMMPDLTSGPDRREFITQPGLAAGRYGRSAGAAGNIATEAAVRAVPDGYTLLQVKHLTRSTRRSTKTLSSISSATSLRSLASFACRVF